MKISETPTPLWLLAFFFSFAEIAMGFAVTQTTESLKTALAIFSVTFPVLVVTAFLLILWKKPYVLYPPRDFGVPADVGSFVNAMRGDQTGKPQEEKPISPEEVGNTKDPLATEQSSENLNLAKAGEASQPHTETRVWELLEKGEYEAGLEVLKASGKGEPERIAIYQFISFEKGHQQALEDLRSSAKAYNEDPNVRTWLAMALGKIGETKAAISEYEQAITLSRNDEQRATVTKLLARELATNDKRDEAICLLEMEIRRSTNIRAKSAMYVACAEIYADEEPPNIIRSFAMYELALLHDPANEDLLFKVAYAYDKQRAPGMSFLHYKNLVDRNPESRMALNNIGWEAHQLGLPAVSVEYYQRAKELGVSLAFSNLANKLLAAGFLDQAKQLLNEAQALGDEIDTRVIRTIGDVAKAEEEEAQNQSEIIKKATRMQVWRRRHAQALIGIPPDRMTVEGTYVDGIWTLEIHLLQEVAIEGSIHRMHMIEPIQIKGTIKGCAIEFSWRQKSTAPSSYWAAGSTTGYGVLIFEADRITGVHYSGKLFYEPSSDEKWEEWVLTRTTSSS